MTREDFEAQLSDAVDQRREEITRVRRVVAELRGTSLAATSILMAIPMLYAHWEGFAKEAITLYLEYVEKCSITPARLNPILFSYAIRKKIAILIQSGSIERFGEFAGWLVSTMSDPIRFGDKNVETQSNLSFYNLKHLCETLSINVGKIEGHRRKLDALIHRRNNIAHTGRPPKFDEDLVEEDAKLILDIILALEMILKECVLENIFMIEPGRAVSPLWVHE